MPSPKPSAQRLELERKPCATCGADPGQACRPSQGSDLVHGARRGSSSTPGRRRTEERVGLELFRCSTCGADPGDSCMSDGRRIPPHAARQRLGRQRELENLPRRSW